ncbi:hypothetical protein BY458DRAFT_492342 [Sporodiniella umbellata]|nr:hypothetical protein BY458DRAFT_492342 [Sporodiniella umbellata]
MYQFIMPYAETTIYKPRQKFDLAKYSTEKAKVLSLFAQLTLNFSVGLASFNFRMLTQLAVAVEDFRVLEIQVCKLKDFRLLIKMTTGSYRVDQTIWKNKIKLVRHVKDVVVVVDLQHVVDIVALFILKYRHTQTAPTIRDISSNKCDMASNPVKKL